MEGDIKVSTIVEGALVAGLTVLLVFVGLNIPLLQPVAGVIWSVPLIVLVVRRDLKAGFLSAIVVFLLLLIFSGPFQALFVLSQLGPLSLVYGYLFQIKAGFGRIIFIGTVTILGSLLGIAILMFLLLDISPTTWMGEVQESAQRFMQAYIEAHPIDRALMGPDPETILQDMFQTFKLLLPGMLVVGAVIAAFLNFIAARAVMIRLKLSVPELPPFRMWRLPWYFIWWVISGLTVWLVGDYLQIQTLKVLGQNLLYIYLPFSIILGLAVAVYFLFYRWHLAPLVRIALIVVLLINFPWVLIMLALLGVFDLVFNYRRLPETGRKESG